MDDLTIAGYTKSTVLNHFLGKTPAEKHILFSNMERSQNHWISYTFLSHTNLFIVTKASNLFVLLLISIPIGYSSEEQEHPQK